MLPIIEKKQEKNILKYYLPRQKVLQIISGKIFIIKKFTQCKTWHSLKIDKSEIPDNKNIGKKKQLHGIKSLLRIVSKLKQKILKYAFGNKHIKLNMSDGRSSFSHSIPHLHGDIFE